MKFLFTTNCTSIVIQRIQTVYLALLAILNGVFVASPLFKRVLEDPAAWLSSIHVAALAFAAVLCIYAIFLFKNRAKQAQMVKISLFFQVTVIGSALGVLFTLGGIGLYLWDEAASWGLLLMGLISQFLALRGIQKDETLVRSMDRIR